MRRVRTFLRSPRTATWLIALAGVWIFLGTLVPQDSVDAMHAAQWRGDYPALAVLTDAIGLHAAYTHPVLLALAIMLAASTAVCAWDRTRRAIREWRRADELSASALRALRERPSFSIVLPAEEPAPQSPLADLERVLNAARMRSRRGPSVLIARSPRLGLLGSPLFHWALVGLLVIAPFGWMARAEGLMGIVEGESAIDSPEAYGVLEVGWLHGELSGLTVSVEDPIETAYVHDGIFRGAAPVVTLRDGDRVVAEGRVYANSPLRYGAMLVHESAYGVGVILSDDSGARESFLVDFADTPDQHSVTRFDIGPETAPTTIEILPHLANAGDGTVALFEPREVRVTASGAEEWSEVLLEGDTFEAAGTLLTIEKIGYYTRLSVVDNPVIYLIYLLLGLAVVGVGIAVALPYRVVHALVTRTDGCDALHVRIPHSRADAAFAARLRERYETAQTPAEETGRSRDDI